MVPLPVPWDCVEHGATELSSSHGRDATGMSKVIKVLSK